MKKIFQIIGEALRKACGMILTLFLLAGLLAWLAPNMAQAQVTPLSIQSGLTNDSVLWATNSAFNLATNRQDVTISQGKGLSVLAVIGASSAEQTTGWYCLRFSVSADGTNWNNSTNQLLNVLAPENGKGPCIIWTNFPIAILDNVRKIRLWDWTNSCTWNTCMVARITNIMFIQKY